MLGSPENFYKLKVFGLAYNYSACSGIFIGAQRQKINSLNILVLTFKKIGIC